VSKPICHAPWPDIDLVDEVEAMFAETRLTAVQERPREGLTKNV
jgi:hypothetical protein